MFTATVLHGRGATLDPAKRPTRTFTTSELAEAVDAGRRNRWLPWSEISRATLKLGVIDHSLHLELGDNRQEKFLWLRADGGYELLEAELNRVLPGRFKAIR